MAIRYVDIEPEEGRPKLAKAPKPAPAAPPVAALPAEETPAEQTPAPAAKAKRRKK